MVPTESDRFDEYRANFLRPEAIPMRQPLKAFSGQDSKLFGQFAHIETSKKVVEKDEPKVFQNGKARVE